MVHSSHWVDGSVVWLLVGLVCIKTFMDHSTSTVFMDCNHLPTINIKCIFPTYSLCRVVQSSKLDVPGHTLAFIVIKRGIKHVRLIIQIITILILRKSHLHRSERFCGLTVGSV